MAEPTNTQPAKSGKSNVATSIMSAFACALVVLTLLVNAVVLLFVLPKFAAVLADHDAQLPSLTIMLFKGQMWIVAGSLLLAILVIGKEFVFRAKVRLTMNIVTLVLTVGIVAVNVFGMFLPMVALIEQTQSP